MNYHIEFEFKFASSKLRNLESDIEIDSYC